MTHMTRWMIFSSLAFVVASRGSFALEVQTGTPDFTLNVSTDLQVRAEGTYDGPPPTTTAGAAPSGHFNTDFFLRRASIAAGGTAYQIFTYYLKLESGRFGARGNYTTPSLIQDMYAGVNPAKGINVEAGFLKTPLSRPSVDSAPATNSLEGVSDILLYPNTRAQRQNGLQARLLLIDERILLRGGIFEGARNGESGGSPVTVPAGTPPLNPQGSPLWAGMARYNFLGADTGYTYPGIYLDGSSHLSVGVGGQFQPHSGGQKDKVSFYDYSALAADVFVDLPVPIMSDSEAVFTFDAYRFDYGPKQPKTGNGLHGETGLRVGPVEPEVNFYWFNSETRQNSFFKAGGGINYYFRGHRAKIMTEYWIQIANGVLPGTPGKRESPWLRQINVQLQIAL